MASDLPIDLKAALDRIAHGISRNDIARQAAAISRIYRDGGGSAAITHPHDALAYAFVRMPATYAAMAACLSAICDARPDFAPVTMLDVGAGPGTAMWAAAQAFPNLSSIKLIDSNPALRALALKLAADSERLGGSSYQLGDAVTTLADAKACDFVVASYLVGELPAPTRLAFAERLWEKTRDMLLIVEPGTSDGYGRILELRTHLIGRDGHVIAPCPHDAACPLAASDWCHFAARLPRLRDHKIIKNADVPYEDEKFAYVALSRDPLPRRAARVLAPPKVTKAAVMAKLCAPDGIVSAAAERRNRTAYARAKRWRWGDIVAPDGVD